MKIPVYAITGFLDSGKTSFLNNMLNRRDCRELQLLVIQFEAGEEEFFSRYENCGNLMFTKRQLENNPEKIIKDMLHYISSNKIDEIWVEWNCMVPVSQLQDLLLNNALQTRCKIQKVFHIADCRNIENFLGRTGSALPGQISDSDFIVLRSSFEYSSDKIRRLIKGINPKANIYETKGMKINEEIYNEIFSRKIHPLNSFLLTSIFIIFIYLFGKPVLEGLNIPVNRVINVFLGIILQAVPFLLIGVLLSSAIQVFIPKTFIEKHFPKSPELGMAVAILAGFCLPVCDCASIPIFRSLVRKGVPLPAAVTFMTVTPIINPVVILSTYYAFGSLNVVLERICLGIVSAIIIGLVFSLKSYKEDILSGGSFDRIMCSCGFYEDTESINSLPGKIGLFIRHSQAEFFDVGKYLMIGSFVASAFQIMGTNLFTSMESGTGLAISIIIMMAIAFALSLCSSSDAIVARSFARQFPMGAVMAFLIFGPMMDIKNIMMLSSGFSKSFILKLLFTAFTVCFLVVFLLYGMGGV